MLRDGRIHMGTFQPSYRYEGFEPDLSATGPGLTSALTDCIIHTLCPRAGAPRQVT